MKPPPTVIAVDFDDVLCDFTLQLITWHNHSNQTTISEQVRAYTRHKYIDLYLQDITSHNQSWESLYSSHDEAVLNIRSFVDSPYFQRLRPAPRALETLKALKSRNFTISVVTSHSQHLAEPVRRFIDRHFPSIFDAIYFTNQLLLTSEMATLPPALARGRSTKINPHGLASKTKSRICVEIGAHYLVEDSPTNALDCAGVGVDVLLFGNCAWNSSSTVAGEQGSSYAESLLPSNMHRVVDWNAVAKRFPRPPSPLCREWIPEQDEIVLDDSESDVEMELDFGHALQRFPTMRNGVVEEDDEEEDEHLPVSRHIRRSNTIQDVADVQQELKNFARQKHEYDDSAIQDDDEDDNDTFFDFSKPPPLKRVGSNDSSDSSMSDQDQDQDMPPSPTDDVVMQEPSISTKRVLQGPRLQRAIEVA